jgi:hypothetical protein
MALSVRLSTTLVSMSIQIQRFRSASDRLVFISQRIALSSAQTVSSFASILLVNRSFSALNVRRSLSRCLNAVRAVRATRRAESTGDLCLATTTTL